MVTWGPMSPRIPQVILDADAAHHRVHQRVAFSRFLNPTNEEEARIAFLRGAEAPPFTYQPFVEADALLYELDAMRPPEDHPAGALVNRCIDATVLFTLALRDRSAAAFDALAQASRWYPEAEWLSLDLPEEGGGSMPSDVSAEQIIARLREALDRRGLVDWVVEADAVMSARVLVDAAKRLIRVKPRARFNARDLDRLVVHEIDVHAIRSVNGGGQQLRCFETGLPDSLHTEEGLAMYAEEVAGVAAPGTLHRQLQVVRAIHLARREGFRAVFDAIRAAHGAGLAWSICHRIKRGLARPEEPGVYAKDSVYLVGRMRVARWLHQGGDIAHLYVGKVGLDDPVTDWLAEGWLRLRPVPRLWERLSPPAPARSSSGTPP